MPDHRSAKFSVSSSGASTTASATTAVGSPSPLSLARHESLEWAPSSNQTSNLRHLTEYERIRLLGRGAFGATHLVKNIIDSRRYALKCIRLPRARTDEGTSKQDVGNKVLREVDALSALRSDNVVRYYGAWVERGELGGDDESDSLVGIDENDVTEWTDDASAAGSGDDDTLALRCACNLCRRNYIDWEISYEQWGLIDSVLQPLNLCTECYKVSLPEDIDTSIIDIRRKCKLPDCLYILMEYAGKTLNEEIKALDDDEKDNAKRWSLFAQCVQGLYSIHQEGYVHRDIKPTNILVQDNVAKIGDLGLASCQIKSSITADNTNTMANGRDNTESAGVGTLLYSAPEVDESRYGKVNDIYSMGIVLIELFSHFATGMERVSVLSKVREGDFPSDWAPGTDQAELARLMVNLDPSRRPSARQVLEMLVQKGLLVDPDPSVLVGIVTQLRRQVETLEQKVIEKEREADTLRRLLQENGIDIPQISSV